MSKSLADPEHLGRIPPYGKKAVTKTQARPQNRDGANGSGGDSTLSPGAPELIQAFAAGLAHDIEEPLRVTRGHLDLVRRKAGDDLDKEVLALLDHAIENLSKGQRLASSLLEYGSHDLRSPISTPANPTEDGAPIQDW